MSRFKMMNVVLLIVAVLSLVFALPRPQDEKNASAETTTETSKDDKKDSAETTTVTPKDDKKESVETTTETSKDDKNESKETTTVTPKDDKNETETTTVTPKDDKGTTTVTPKDDKETTTVTPKNESKETTTVTPKDDKNASAVTTADDKNVTVVTATLDLGEFSKELDENVIRDHFGNALKDMEVLNITLGGGAVVRLFTEKWRTYYTHPATWANCLCLTRAPLSKFKLYGNIHFPYIKITTPRYVPDPSSSTTSTPCPPCPECPHCGDENLK